MDCIGRGGKGGGSPGHSSLPLWADKAKSVRAVQWVAVSVSERTTVRLEIIQENVHMATVEIICWSVVMMIRVWHIFKSMMCSLKKKKEKRKKKAHRTKASHTVWGLKLSNFINWRLNGNTSPQWSWWLCCSHYMSMVCINKMYHINKCFTWANGWHSVTGCILTLVGKVTQWQAWLVHERCLKKYGNEAKRDLSFTHSQTDRQTLK